MGRHRMSDYSVLEPQEDETEQKRKAGGKAGGRNEKRTPMKTSNAFIIGCQMPAWDRERSVDVGSGLQSPATAQQEGLCRKNNSPRLTCRQWKETLHTEARKQRHTGWCLCVCTCLFECTERPQWRTAKSWRSTLALNTNMQLRKANLLKGLTRKNNNSKFPSHQLRHHTWTPTHEANTHSCFKSIIQSGTSLRSSRDAMASLSSPS